ncbi:MAG: amino acid ABC transporter substrate-binding protein [Burkholderiaceae bacterium]|nr:amino acid ABC transporter substrate-binding protein [Burkholderiaceae bacterium]
MQLPRIHALAVAAALILSMGTAAAQVDTLKTIKDSGKLVIGVRDASGAMSFTLGPGQYTGFHVEICERIAADIKAAVKLDKLNVTYQLVTPQNRISLVRNGTVHLECGTTTNNAARQQDVAFAPTLFVEGVRIAVKASSPVTGISQLEGKTVAATTGSTAVQAVRRIGKDAGGKITELLGKDNSEGFLLLETGRAEAFVADGQILATLISRSREPAQYKILEPVLSVEPIAIMIAKDDPAFKAIVDKSVITLAKSGEVARLYDKWFIQPIPPQGIKVGLPANAQTKAAWANPSDKPMEEYGPR